MLENSEAWNALRFKVSHETRRRKLVTRIAVNVAKLPELLGVSRD